MKYLKTSLRILILLSFLKIIIIGQSDEYVEKKAGICFRIDDDKEIYKYSEYAEVFDSYGLNFTFALNLAMDQITPAYIEMVKDLQSNGHEMMDHTPWHRTNYFHTAIGTDYYLGHNGVERIAGSKIELKHKSINIDDAKRSGTLKVDGNIITSSEGIFSEFSKSDCYLYFPSPIDELVYIDDRTGWINDNTVIVRDVWRNSVNLGYYENTQFYNFHYYNVHLTTDAIRALAEETLRLAEYYELARPTSWIQPGGYHPQPTKEEIKEALSTDLGFIAAGIFPNPSLKVFDEYDPNNACQFGMDWGDFRLYATELEEVKTIIANKVAKNHLLIGSSHLNNLLNDDWDAYLERVDGLLAWCTENEIPVRTYEEWSDILYQKNPDLYQNIFPELSKDRDNDGYPDGYHNSMKTPEEWVVFEGEWNNDDGVPESNNHSFSLNKIGNICYVGRQYYWVNDALAGLEKGKNDFSIWTKGATGNFIEVSFKVGNTSYVYKFPAESETWTKYNLEQSINGNTTLVIPENISLVDVSIKCSDYSSGTVKISGMSLKKKIELNELNLDLTVFLEGAYSNNNEMITSINSLLPLAQPFNCAPCYYSGTEAVNNMPNVNIIDWVLVSLFTEIDDEEPEIRRTGFLRNDGKIVDLDGYSPLSFNVANTQYYIKVEHRNHLPITSSQRISLE